MVEFESLLCLFVLPINHPSNDHHGERLEMGRGGNNCVTNQDQRAGEEAASPCPEHVNKNSPEEGNHSVYQGDSGLEEAVLGVGDAEFLEGERVREEE